MKIKARWERTIQVAQYSPERLELEVEREVPEDLREEYAALAHDLSQTLAREGDKLVRERMIHHGLIDPRQTGPVAPDPYR